MAAELSGLIAEAWRDGVHRLNPRRLSPLSLVAMILAANAACATSTRDIPFTVFSSIDTGNNKNDSIIITTMTMMMVGNGQQ